MGVGEISGEMERKKWKVDGSRAFPALRIAVPSWRKG
jgi:hypothetical protein